MTTPFVKMQAQGNDFVILDALHETIPEPDTAWLRDLAERRYGIGCDQVLYLSPERDCDARMRIFNADGSEAMNCGNGLRCAADLLMRRLGKKRVRIALVERKVDAWHTENGVRVCMGSARILNVRKTHIDVEIGNRHRVLFALRDERIEADEYNIEIVTGEVADHIYIDIIERGVGPTRACGSGACATAVAIWQRDGRDRPLSIVMPGGMVRVSREDDNIHLEGRVAEVFRGEYDGKGDRCSIS